MASGVFFKNPSPPLIFLKNHLFFYRNFAGKIDLLGERNQFHPEVLSEHRRTTDRLGFGYTGSC